jgi:alkanesulfonate monooxygenase SsuD/methylene tetrahydromethanopterin reductase-like flavin-dependent oxidoreductase (luciferase family)
MDYGHELRFGAFITPSSKDPRGAVGLAVAAEHAGLDLVTFQDHPYQPAFLDTWTLLSFVAARTERVSLAPNVANLPLRPPAVLARSAASLDLLSGGRVELGLGAGAFWEAIEALGGPRRTPRDAVDALAEAIRVIHAAWGRSDDRFVGDFYRSKGAKTGPVPAHDIGVWLGAYKPRMLELTGSVADGWLPSLGRMDAQQISAANERIDDAAGAAGRRPEDVTRLANLGGEISSDTSAEWVGRIEELALSHGFSTFVFASDQASELAVVGQEIAPAVRAAVAAARSQRD